MRLPIPTEEPPPASTPTFTESDLRRAPTEREPAPGETPPREAHLDLMLHLKKGGLLLVRDGLHTLRRNVRLFPAGLHQRLTQVGRQLRHKLIEAPVAGVRDLVWRGCAWYIQVNMIKGHTQGLEPDGPFDQIRRLVMSEGNQQPPPDNHRLATAVHLLADHTESLDAELRDFKEETAKRFDKVDERFDKVDKRFDRVDARIDKVWGELSNPRGERLEDLVRVGLDLELDEYCWTHGIPVASEGLELKWRDRMLREPGLGMRAWHRVSAELGIDNRDSSLRECDFLMDWTIVDRGRTHRILFVGEVGTDANLKRQQKLERHCADLERVCAQATPGGPTAFVPILAGLPHRLLVKPADLVNLQIAESDFDNNSLGAGAYANLPAVLDRLLERKD